MSICYSKGFQLADDGKLPTLKEFEEMWMRKIPDNSKTKYPST